ncbi:hypothetical protein GCK72_015492 [Caenorhabditis remanei]|uniref:Uncharacterized protein n=1 Tax=Caenorhabditis remanei TaxID=31234 RepID=A0A6A5GXD6_CAERE|nr:hypothetical protein GCK72_015492 [Caenorhabditis remanei]KAF1759032.1 hypothetical protein GCK72_015492 [Caenorhabditis remanei]
MVHIRTNNSMDNYENVVVPNIMNLFMELYASEEGLSINFCHRCKWLSTRFLHMFKKTLSPEFSIRNWTYRNATFKPVPLKAGCFDDVIGFACSELCHCKGHCTNKLKRTSFEIERKNKMLGFQIKTQNYIPAGTVIAELTGESVKYHDLLPGEIFMECTDQELNFIFVVDNFLLPSNLCINKDIQQKMQSIWKTSLEEVIPVDCDISRNVNDADIPTSLTYKYSDTNVTRRAQMEKNSWM